MGRKAVLGMPSARILDNRNEESENICPDIYLHTYIYR
jgi:hypothetical protein